MTDETTQALLPVTRADREAAASGYFAWISGNPVIPAKMRAGKIDDHSMIQAFARHRLAHSLPSQADATSGEEMRLREATQRALSILERNLHRQTEKCDDAVRILRAALTKGAK